MADIEQGLKEAIAEAAAKKSAAQLDAGDRWSDSEQAVLQQRNPSRIIGRLPGTDEALAKAKAIHGEHGDSIRPYVIGNGNVSGLQHMTAPQLMEHLETLTKSAAVLEGLAFDLSNDLAGHNDYSGAKELAPPNVVDMTVFDRIGVRLLELTRTIESIEREVKRSLVAVNGMKL